MKKEVLNIFAIIAVFMLSAFFNFSIVSAAPTTITTINTNDRAAVINAYNSYYTPADPSDAWSGSLASCLPGTTAQAFKDRALTKVNYFRAMSGLNSITENSSYTANAQASALIMAKNGWLDHQPPSTALCYSAAGYTGSDNGNLALGYGGTSSIQGWMDDRGEYTIGLGHRISILQPKAGSMGFGYVPSSSGYYSSSTLDWQEGLTSTRAVDSSASKGGVSGGGLSLVPWPNKGFTPYQNTFLNWSITGSGVDWTAASVSVKKAGVACSNNPTINTKTNRSSFYTLESVLVWDMKTLSGYCGTDFQTGSNHIKPASDTTYTITISGAKNSLGLPISTFSYDTTVIDTTFKPTGINFSASSINENTATGTIIGSLSQSGDLDLGDSWTYALDSGVSGAIDNGLVTITGNQVKINSILNYEQPKTSLSFGVKVTDSTGNSFSKLITVSVININEAPTDIILSNNNISNPNAALGSPIGSLSTTDPDSGQTFTYSLLNLTDRFQLSGNQLQTKAFSFALPNESLQIKVTDQAGLSFTKTFTINISGTKPTDISMSVSSIAENSPVGTVIGVLGQSGDLNSPDSWTYSLDGTVAGAIDNSLVMVSGNQLKVNSLINFESPKTSLKIGVKVTDSVGNSFSKLISISVSDINEPATSISLSNNSYIGSPLASGTTLASVSGTDPDAGQILSYSLVPGQANNNLFSIVGGTLKNTSSLTTGTYSIVIRATDNGSPVQYKDQTLSFTVSPTPPQTALVPVYRFWSDTYQKHFYTADANEKNYVTATYSNIWSYEGISYYVSPLTSGTCPSGTTAIYRFWSDQLTGHFYTASASERDMVIATWPDVWNRYEGPQYCVSTYSHDKFNNQVYRFWSDKNRAHFYTASASERDMVIATWPDVWNRYEGGVFYVSGSQ